MILFELRYNIMIKMCKLTYCSLFWDYCSIIKFTVHYYNDSYEVAINVVQFVSYSLKSRVISMKIFSLY